MKNNETTSKTLPMLALKDIPQPKEGAANIVGLVKKSGKINGYQLSDGRTVDKQAGVALARQGEIRGVGIAHRNGSEYLKSIPDSGEANNLANLPSTTN